MSKKIMIELSIKDALNLFVGTQAAIPYLLSACDTPKHILSVNALLRISNEVEAQWRAKTSMQDMRELSDQLTNDTFRDHE